MKRIVWFLIVFVAVIITGCAPREYKSFYNQTPPEGSYLAKDLYCEYGALIKIDEYLKGKVDSYSATFLPNSEMTIEGKNCVPYIAYDKLGNTVYTVYSADDKSGYIGVANGVFTALGGYIEQEVGADNISSRPLAILNTYLKEKKNKGDYINITYDSYSMNGAKQNLYCYNSKNSFAAYTVAQAIWVQANDKTAFAFRLDPDFTKKSEKYQDWLGKYERDVSRAKEVEYIHISSAPEDTLRIDISGYRIGHFFVVGDLASGKAVFSRYGADFVITKNDKSLTLSVTGNEKYIPLSATYSLLEENSV